MDSIYDDAEFFNVYAAMARSQQGLEAAGEWHQLKTLFPNLEGKSVLDMGCGYGWHYRYCVEKGASKVLGIDASVKMINEARERNSDNAIEYRVCSIQDYSFPENEWDFVISNLGLHYVENLEDIFKKVFRALKPEGIFLFNIEHPVFTAGINQEWIYEASGQPKYWPIDNYYFSGARETHFLGLSVTKYHHTLTEILMGLINNHFNLDAVVEAQPPQSMLHLCGMSDELKRPMMLLVRASKKSS